MARNHYTSEDSFLLNNDYSLDGYVSMRRTDFDHGFTTHNQNDRIRGTMGTKRGEHFGKGPKGWQRSDERIREEVCEVLYHSPFVDASDIDVSVMDGIVTLEGMVLDREMKREAERCIDDILGVHDVNNKLVSPA